MITQASHYDAITPDALARIIRPVIGLTERQANANLRYWNSVWQSGVEAGMSPRAAEARADRLAATYAARQHRYRAIAIARTELAMAYNEGAYGATVAAQEQGYLGDVVKRWLTAADERVCKICAPLDGEVVNLQGFFPDKSGGKRPAVKLPPAHPQCRCAIAYEEISPNLQPSTNADILASGGVGDTDGYTEITEVREIDFNDEAAVMREIEQFAETYAYADVEHALVITPSGKIYSLKGNDATVNPGIINRDELRGSIVIHNHPLEHGFDMGDSFSRNDLMFAARHGLGRQYLVSGERRNLFEFTGNPTADSVYDAWIKAEMSVLTQTFSANSVIRQRQESTVKVLRDFLEGAIFHDSF